jgi:hypothetical protein
LGFSDLCLRSALSGWVIVNYPKSHSRPRSSGISQRRMDCSGSQADAGIRPCLHQSATPASPLTDPGQLAQRNPVPSHRRPGKTGLAVLVAQIKDQCAVRCARNKISIGLLRPRTAAFSQQRRHIKEFPDCSAKTDRLRPKYPLHQATLS